MKLSPSEIQRRTRRIECESERHITTDNLNTREVYVKMAPLDLTQEEKPKTVNMKVDVLKRIKDFQTF
jgi:hypothetical protein